MIPFACGHNLQTARKRALCLEVTSIQLITSKRNVGSYMTIDWTLYFIRWSTLNLTRWALSENECSIGAPMLVPRQGEMPSYPYEPGCESRTDSLLTPGMDNTRHFYSITGRKIGSCAAVVGLIWSWVSMPWVSNWISEPGIQRFPYYRIRVWEMILDSNNEFYLFLWA